jgi:CRISPR-associated DxTHG motif protein
MQEAVQELFEPTKLFVAMTPPVRDKHDATLSGHLSYERLDIPNGRNEEEWWDVFETIVDAVPQGATLTIDITHGFRSQPLVVLAVALYLEAASDVTVKRIVYGAFDKSKDSDGTEVLDLTSFLDLIEWSVAARQFLRDGSAEILSDLMKEIHGTAHRTGEARPQHASTAGNQLERLTEALSVVRPREVGEERAAGLIEATESLKDDIERVPQLRPLSLLLDRIQERVAPMQTTALFDEGGFAAQAEMMQFFLDTDQLQQAVTLAREAMISHRALQLGHSPEPVARSNGGEGGRQKAEENLNGLAHTASEERSAGEDALADLWSQLIDVRNDINHAGMNADPAPGDNLSGRARTVVDDVAAHVSPDVEAASGSQ